jgi:hypothetical protein
VYVIVKVGTREFVARPGSAKSYTKNVFEARLFETEEQAKKDICPVNEYVVRLDTLLKGANA